MEPCEEAAGGITASDSTLCVDLVTQPDLSAGIGVRHVFCWDMPRDRDMAKTTTSSGVPWDCCVESRSRAMWSCDTAVGIGFAPPLPTVYAVSVTDSCHRRDPVPLEKWLIKHLDRRRCFADSSTTHSPRRISTKYHAPFVIPSLMLMF